MHERPDPDLRDYYRKGVPLNSPEIFVILLGLMGIILGILTFLS